jgi:hypothetical protein
MTSRPDIPRWERDIRWTIGHCRRSFACGAALIILVLIGSGCRGGDRRPTTASRTASPATRPAPAADVPDRFTGQAREAVAALLALDAALRARDARTVCHLTVPDYLAFASAQRRDHEERECVRMFGKRGEFKQFASDYARRVLRARVRGPRATLRVVETNRGRSRSTTVRMVRVDRRWRMSFTT